VAGVQRRKELGRRDQSWQRDTLACLTELTEIGLPPAYGKEGAKIHLFSGDAVHAFSRRELEEMLGQAVLMDGPALRHLQELGLAELAGFEIAGTRERDTLERDTLERFTSDPLNGPHAGWWRDCRPSFWRTDAFLLRPTGPGSRTLAELIDLQQQSHGPVMGVSENRLGGRVAALGYYPWTFFSYLYWDVVPQSVLGRFNAMAKIVTVSSGMVWSFWIVGYAEHHPKEVYIAVSLVCTAIYVLSLIMVKEGEYPPPEPRKTKSVIEPIRDYVKDCYSKPYFLWIFLGTLCYQLGNQGGGFQFFYLREDLGMDLGATGWIQGIASGVVTAFGVLLGYSSGSLIDRFKPIRVVPLTMFVSSTLALVSFFVISEKVSAATMASLVGINNFVFGVALGAVTVQLFPREKLGQFCSAQAFFYQTIIMVLSPLAIAPFFDWLDFNRGGYLWSAFFYLLAGLVTVKVYFNWKKKQSENPVAE
jgi:hypothetical protein